MSEIVDGLYIGNWRDAQNRAFLVNRNVTHILCAASELRPVFTKVYDYLHIQAQDTQSYNIMRHFDTAASYINNAIKNKGTILVHCFAGISRSSSLVIAYLMKYQKMTMNQALKLCVEKRPRVQPNPGFKRQLLEYERKLEAPDQGEVEPKMEPNTSQQSQGGYLLTTGRDQTQEPKLSLMYKRKVSQGYAPPLSSSKKFSYNMSAVLSPLKKPNISMQSLAAAAESKQTRSQSSVSKSMKTVRVSDINKPKLSLFGGVVASPTKAGQFRQPKSSLSSSRVPSARIDRLIPPKLIASADFVPKKERCESKIDLARPLQFSIHEFDSKPKRVLGGSRNLERIQNQNLRTSEHRDKMVNQKSNLKKIKDSTYQSFFEGKVKKDSDWRPSFNKPKRFYTEVNKKPLSDLRNGRDQTKTDLSEL